MIKKEKDTILTTIIHHKQVEIESRKNIVSIEKLKEMPAYNREGYSIKNRLESPDQIGIIAEIKKQSPSKGIINANVSILDIALGYQKSNVAGISILTDNKYFGGSLDYIKKVRSSITIPILQKDFIIDPYQIHEAKAYGADVILLIASALALKDCQNLAKLAKSINLEVLLEVHNLEELNNYISDEVTMLGVNNRDLKTFKTGIQNSVDLAPHIPKQYIKIAESGINSPHVLLELKKTGYQGFLIGEHFMKEQSPQEACRTFSNTCNKLIKEA